MADSGDRPKKSPPPGWYTDREMVDTVRYWDGSDWTDRVAPAEPDRGDSSPSTRKIAFGVFWGILAAGAALAFLGSCQQQQDEVDCITDNLNSAMEGGYQRDCG